MAMGVFPGCLVLVSVRAGVIQGNLPGMDGIRTDDESYY